ncbi:F-box protein [Melia azedarach]|uniref:F-box protein n=1 Tax=Melia azedarach TaxID=155640 RepID=A0ACC1Y0L4_MELAZ|nr:F-box protein [Melia azedarach]
MARKVIKKENKKHVPHKVEDDASALKPWPDLPQQLINAISWQPSLMLDTSHGGVTKSWRAQTKQCNSQAILPWFELRDGDADKKFKFIISFHEGEWSWSTWDWRRRTWGAPWRYYVGFFGGLLVGRLPPTEYYLHFHRRQGSNVRLPPWDERVPFHRAVISSSTRDPDCRDFILMVLTGISYPAFVFYRRKARSKHEWIKQDCNIPDPHSSTNKSERKVSLMRFTNAIGYKGKFYALSLQGNLAVIEDFDSQPIITALGPKRAVPSVWSRHFKEYLLESDGKILLVFLISKKSVDIVDEVEVFQLDVGTLLWIKKDGIGDRTLFLGSNCCMSVSASKMRCRSNCVYFIDHISEEDWWVYDFRRGNISPCKRDAIFTQGLSFRLDNERKK